MIDFLRRDIYPTLANYNLRMPLVWLTSATCVQFLNRSEQYSYVS